MLDLRPRRNKNGSRPTKLSKFGTAADCAVCPCAWEDMSYEGECYDCGCVASKHMTGKNLICRAPDWAKRLIRRRADARSGRAEARACEGMAEWFKESERKDEAMRRAIAETFPGFIPGHDGAAMLRMRYEENLKEKEDGTEK